MPHSHPHVHRLGHRRHLRCRLSGARGESIPETGARWVVLGVWWSCKDPHKHKYRGAQLLRPFGRVSAHVTLRVCQQTTSGLGSSWTELRACGSQLSEARAPWTFEHFADQGVELIEVDRISQYRNISDQHTRADLYRRLTPQKHRGNVVAQQ